MNAPVEIEPRRPLTRRETIELAVRQEGRCGCGCGVKLNALTEGVIDEHVIPLEWGGSNDLPNRQLWRHPCAKAKTVKEAPQTAKVKRLAGETCSAPTRRPLKSRGFDKTRRRTMSGRVEVIA